MRVMDLLSPTRIVQQTGLTMALVPILPLKIKKMVVASYQAISGSGYPGHSALDMFTNVIPYIS